MKLLLDTHAFLWSLMDPGKLSEAARHAIADPDNQITVSAITFWEIALKAALGKLTLVGTTPEGLVDAAQRQGFDLLALDPRLAAGFSGLPKSAGHRDPFDRMLMWQCLSLGHTLVSRDRKLTAETVPGLRILW